MKLIIDIDEQHFELLQMAVMNGMGDNAQKIIAQGTPIPDNASNGDVINTMFDAETAADIQINSTEYWWNASYQKGGKK